MNSSIEIIRIGEHKGITDLPYGISPNLYYFKNREFGKYGKRNKPCFTVVDNKVESHYYIGVDWLSKARGTAIYISPKLNHDGFETDYLKMLLTCLNDPKASKYIDTIYDIKSEETSIEIDQSDDLLSPLLIVQFLNLVKILVRKGLKKSYYREEKHLDAKVKGKLLVSQTLKNYTYKNEPLKTICAFDIFGLDHPENQILKAALLFVQKYLSEFPEYKTLVSRHLQYCLPAFEEVTVPKNLKRLQHFKTSAFFSSYKEATRIAQLILRRFGHNVRSIEAKKIHTQPFWINMPLLFELYAYTLLRKTYGENIRYQYKSDYQELDFLLDYGNFKMVIDTKYKTKYGKGGKNKEDIRQLAGYARMEKVYDKIGKLKSESIDCLIIYPIRDKDVEEIKELCLDDKKPIDKYVGFYRLGLVVPSVKKIKLNQIIRL